MPNRTVHAGGGRVENATVFSPALGVEKRFNIYLPPGYEEGTERYPVLYLFRGHEKEWFDPYQDHSRGGTAVQHLADELIHSGAIGPMIIVGASTTSDDGSVFGLGVDFLNPRRTRERGGVGTGRFEQYVVEDLIGHVDRAYRTIPDGEARGADGFSLGGFTAVMLAVKHPGLFGSVGCYDGSFMFRNLVDPRLQSGAPDDPLWVRADDLFAAAFRRPRARRYDIDYMLGYNPLNIVERLSDRERAVLEKTRFYIHSASSDGRQGNRDRCVHLASLFLYMGIPNEVKSLILSSDAMHTWRFADLHLRLTLRRHSRAFGLTPVQATPEESEAPLGPIDVVEVRSWEGWREDPEVTFHAYASGPLKVDIYNRFGEYITCMLHEEMSAGRHQRQWNGRNHQGNPVPSGVYYLQFSGHWGSRRHKFIYLK